MPKDDAKEQPKFVFFRTIGKTSNQIENEIWQIENEIWQFLRKTNKFKLIMTHPLVCWFVICCFQVRFLSNATPRIF